MAVHIRREHVFEDSYRELHRRTPEEIKNRLYVVFDGEEGQDAGTRLFFVRIIAWKASKYGVISGPYFPVFSPNTGKYEPEITPYLDTFHAVNRCDK